MKHFRIVKRTETYGHNEPEVIYLIQKRFLFFFYIYFRSKVVFSSDRIRKYFPTFFNEEKAKEYLYELQHPFKEHYKGHLIKKILMDNGMRYFDVTYYYKNPSRYYERGLTFMTIEEIKEYIDGLEPIIEKEYIY